MLNISQEKIKYKETDCDSLQFSILASGSSGNCTYIESAHQRLLVDAGLSGKKVEALLKQIGRNLADIDAILVTHEHKDHIHGVGVLSRKYNLPIYANARTWSLMDQMIGKIDPDNRRLFEAEQMLTFGDLDVLSYEVSHDAIQPQFYAFQKADKQFVMLTDTGYVSEKLRWDLKNASAYLIESNHEIEMLRSGRYPWSLKQRILSDKGHLSNVDGALAMVDLIGDKTKSIYLGHLSRDNNTKELAMEAMRQTLSQEDFAVDEAFHVYMTDPIKATALNRL
ncbi:MBL fold metallo-hydrolase [Ignavigranum ruoffiae]|uniref:MBL fold metallo-hydrolase n=1 Tax=Ignavigranum ruoffiae TaxID=89093 RepID=UPI002052C094|nr:MBL fold metallo-hydrolase [Ignavigranum ruoffiae]UPQ86561.1 MBL fold metallo-hydrolase [Ignavigranum ruoffiae]